MLNIKKLIITIISTYILENIFGILDENNVYTYYQTIGTPFAPLLQNL